MFEVTLKLVGWSARNLISLSKLKNAVSMYTNESEGSRFVDSL